MIANLVLSLTCRAGEISYPPDITKALEKAGDNRVELLKVFDHYQATGDSLKLRAAYFLVANMEGHSYMQFGLFDSTKAEVAFNVLDYTNYDSLLKAWDELQKLHPGLDFDKKINTEDLTVIKADFLIKQIDLAFRAWQEKPWAGGLTFEQFCEYVLPYRGSNEPLEDWRGMFYDKYKGLEGKMKDSADPVEAAGLINNDIKTYFTFDPRYYYHPTDEGLSEMLSAHLGRCEDMTNIAIYAMRANALAVTSDYTPFWANSGNNHAWNAILDKSGKVIPFMGAEANPGEYKLWNKLAKVYRKTYAQQKNNLIFQERKQKKVPGWLGGKGYIDVTSDYVKTYDISVPIRYNIPDTDIVYICVFNDGKWQPIQWGRIAKVSSQDYRADFKAMGADIAYLPAYYVQEDSLIAAGLPFILTSDGKMDDLIGRPLLKLDPITVFSTTAREQAPSTDGIKKSSLTAGATYELFYWEGKGWHSIGEKVASDQPLTFNVQLGYLYWLVEKDSDREERIFTIDENGKQVWW